MHIIFCGCTNNYPEAFSANNTKFGLLSDGLASLPNVDVTILNECFFADSPSDKDIDVVYKARRIVTFKNTGLRTLLKVKNLFRSIKLFSRIKGDERVLIISCGNFTPRFIYIIIAHLLGYKVGYVFHEYHRGFKHNGLEKMWAYLKDTLFPKMCDFTLPISEFLVKESLKYNKHYFKLPIIADFNKKNISDYKPVANKYFCYCASAAYYDTAQLIIDSYSLIKEQKDYSLCMVLYGNKHKIETIRDYIGEKGQNEHIQIKSQLSDDELFSCFSNASGLLIPLNPNKITDIARFSQKIAEYLSSKAPIISTNVGEIPYYFHNKKDILVADFTDSSIAQAMNFCIENSEKSNQIGIDGYYLGLKQFSHEVVASDMVKYIKTLYNS